MDEFFGSTWQGELASSLLWVGHACGGLIDAGLDNSHQI